MMLNRLLLLLSSMAFTFLVYAGPVPWKENSYTYYAQGTTLGKALTDFARTFGIQIQGVENLRERLDGRFATLSPTDYLNRLAGLYGLNWYYYNGTLFVNRSTTNVTKPVVVGADSLKNVKSALNELGILEPRFGWGELPEQSLVLLSGPPSYVSLIEKTVKAIPTSSSGQQVMVFRLKYANVDDRVFIFNDKEITTPGIATIIRQLVSGTYGGGSSNQAIGSRSQLVEIAKPVQAGTAAVQNMPPDSTSTQSDQNPLPQTPPPNLQRNKNAPSITADSRLNALIIKDTADTEPIYQQLVALLDNPTALVQIEAMIVDVDIAHVTDLGVNWAGRSGNVSAGFGGDISQNSNGMLLNIGSTLNPASTIIDAGNAIISRINILAKQNNAQIIGRPSILTSDNLPAFISFNESYYVRVSGEKVANLQQVTAGMTLKVTPRVIQKNGKNHIYLAVDIEDGQLLRNDASTTIGGLPGTRTSTINTQAVLTENESLLIGGYIRDKTTKGDSGVPYLRKVPVLGWFFRNKTTDKARAERLFMITPKILSIPVGQEQKDLLSQDTGPAGLVPALLPGTLVEKRSVPRNLPEESMARTIIDGSTPANTVPEVQAELLSRRATPHSEKQTQAIPPSISDEPIAPIQAQVITSPHKKEGNILIQNK